MNSPARILKALTAVLGVVLALEAGLWILSPLGPEPAIRVECRQDFPGLKEEITYERNGLGLRSLSINSWKKRPGTIRILCLGASTTDQGTHDTADTWMAMVEEGLSRRFPGVRIEVGAYGRGGSKIFEVLRWCHRNLSRLDPDVVITLFGINELCTDVATAKRISYERLIADYIEKEPGVLERCLGEYSQIYRHTRAVRENRFRRRQIREGRGVNFDVSGVGAFRSTYWRTPEATDFDLGESHTALFARLTGYLIGRLKGDGIRLIVLGQPLLLTEEMDYSDRGDGSFALKMASDLSYEEIMEAKRKLLSIWFIVNDGRRMLRLQPGTFRGLMQRYNDTQGRIARQHGVAYIDLQPHVAPTLENFFDDCHFTNAGTRKVADAILPTVEETVREILASRPERFRHAGE